MYLPCDVPSIVPKILLNRQTSISCIIRRNVWSVLIRAVAGRIIDSIWGRIIKNTREERISVKYHWFGSWMGCWKVWCWGSDDRIVLMYHSAIRMRRNTRFDIARLVVSVYFSVCWMEGTYCSFQRWQVHEEIVSVSYFINGFNSFKFRSNDFGIEWGEIGCVVAGKSVLCRVADVVDPYENCD
jgi:hypothetical protein